MFATCKQPESQSASKLGAITSKVLPVTEKYILHNQFDNNEALIKDQRAATISILDHRLKSIDPSLTNVLVQDMWHVDAFLRGNQMSFASDIKGFWIDFQDGNKYAYGSFSETYGTGRCVYTSDNNLLLLLDDDQRIKPQEFEVKYNNDALVLVGQATYHDNSMQVKLLRKATFPEQAQETWDGSGGEDVEN